MWFGGQGIKAVCRTPAVSYSDFGTKNVSKTWNRFHKGNNIMFGSKINTDAGHGTGSNRVDFNQLKSMENCTEV